MSNIISVIPEPRPQVYFTRGLMYLEDFNEISDKSINVFDAMLFAANQYQNETYDFKEMMRKDDC